VLELQEISDRIEIQQLLARYSDAIDRRRWDALDDLFTADAVIDYTAMGGIRGDLPTIKAYLAETLAMFSSTQHLLGAGIIDIDGDAARSVTPCHNPMMIGEGDDAQLLLCGLWYHDELVRTGTGWRICDRREERCYMRFFRATRPRQAEEK
jgi:SnoaL-like domain